MVYNVDFRFDEIWNLEVLGLVNHGMGLEIEQRSRRYGARGSGKQREALIGKVPFRCMPDEEVANASLGKMMTLKSDLQDKDLGILLHLNYGSENKYFVNQHNQRV